jgi:nucleotide-binding universal stress UspA family protein
VCWKPIIVGVDGSAEAAAAARMARLLADCTGTRCAWVHVTQDVARVPLDLAHSAVRPEFANDISDLARGHVVARMEEQFPGETHQIEVRLGTPSWGLKKAIDDHGAGLLVLGRKRRRAPSRWWSGSTAHRMIRSVDVPVLVVAQTAERMARILVASDLSYAGGPALEATRRFATALDAEVLAIHVLEAHPTTTDTNWQCEEPTSVPEAEVALRDAVDASLGREADIEVHRGKALDVVQQVADQWAADLVVVGSHGRNWVDRILIGSTTERLLTRMARSLLVVPVRGPGGSPTTLAAADRHEWSGRRRVRRRALGQN